jgi:hypothetical protein
MASSKAAKYEVSASAQTCILVRAHLPIRFVVTKPAKYPLRRNQRSLQPINRSLFLCREIVLGEETGKSSPLRSW